MNPNTAETFSFAAPEGAPAFPVAPPRPQTNPPPHMENSLEYWRTRARILDPVVHELQKQLRVYREQIKLLDTAKDAFNERWEVKYDEVKAHYDQLFKENKQQAQAHAAAASEWETTVQKLTEEKLALEEKADELTKEKLALEEKADKLTDEKLVLGEKADKLTEEKVALEEKADEWNGTKQMLTGEKLALQQKVADMAACSSEEVSKRTELQTQIDELVKQNDQLAVTISELEAAVEDKRGQVAKLSAEVQRKEMDIQQRDHEYDVAINKRDEYEKSLSNVREHLRKTTQELQDARKTSNTEVEQLRSVMDDEKRRFEADKKTYEEDLKDRDRELREKGDIAQEYRKAVEQLEIARKNAERLETDVAELTHENERLRSHPMEHALDELPTPVETRGRGQLSLDRELSSADNAESDLSESESDSGSDHIRPPQGKAPAFPDDITASVRSVSEEKVESSVENSTLSSDTDPTLSDSGVESTIRTSTNAPNPIRGLYPIRTHSSRTSRMYELDRNTRARIHTLSESYTETDRLPTIPSNLENRDLSHHISNRVSSLTSEDGAYLKDLYSDPGESSRLASNGSRSAPADGEAAVSTASVGTPEPEPDSHNAAVATDTTLPSTLLVSDELSDNKIQKLTTEDRLTIEPSSKDSPLIDMPPRVTTQSQVKEVKEEEEVTASGKSSSFMSNEDQKVKDAGDIIEEKPTGYTASECTVGHPPTPQGLDVPATVIEAERAQEATASGKSGSFKSNEDAGDIIEAKPTGHTASESTAPTLQGLDVLATVIEPGRAHIAEAGERVERDRFTFTYGAPNIAMSKSKTISHNPFRCWLQVYIDLWTCFMGWLAFQNSSLITDTGLNDPHPRTKYLQINRNAPYDPEHTDLKPPSSKAASGENARAYRDRAPPKIELPPFWTNVFWLLTHIAIYAFCYICASNYSRILRERANWQAANELTRQMFLRDYGYIHRHFGEQNWLDIICFNLSTWLDVGPSYSG